jgi:hypothetical protein
MSNYYLNYSQYLAAKACCQNTGLVGPQGPSGLSTIGPTGFTGPSGQMILGPTGKPRRGPTGPTGQSGGFLGPTGPTGPISPAFTFTSLSFDPLTNSITIPTQPTALSYYSLTLTANQSLDSILFDSTPPTGSQFVIVVGNPPSGIAGITTQINTSTFVSNISPNFNVNSTTRAVLSILFDGTTYYCTAYHYSYI